jgi:hypothetical protein
VGTDVVVDSGIVEVVGDVVVVASELPLLESAKLNPNAIKATTTRTAPIRTEPNGRHFHLRRAAA